jgi:hypothetical protein
MVMLFDSDFGELQELSREAVRLLTLLDITCSQSSSSAAKPSSQLENLIQAVNHDVPEVITHYANCCLAISGLSRNDSHASHSLSFEFEEAEEGGSFFLTMIGQDAWLFPAVSTLRNFDGLHQAQGIFTCVKRSVKRPQLVSPARLLPSLLGWQIAEPGTIAVPE